MPVPMSIHRIEEGLEAVGSRGEFQDIREGDLFGVPEIVLFQESSRPLTARTRDDPVLKRRHFFGSLDLLNNRGNVPLCELEFKV